MKSLRVMTAVGVTLLACGIVFSHPALTTAQETPQEKPAQPRMTDKEEGPGMQGMHSMMGKGKGSGMMARMHEMHEQMEIMHREMMEELQKQLTALREHSKTLDGINDGKQLLTELKKHQQMTDELLGTMVEQRAKMQAHMQAHREQMQEQMRKRKEQAEQRKKKQTEGHGAHHGEE